MNQGDVHDCKEKITKSDVDNKSKQECTLMVDDHQVDLDDARSSLCSLYETGKWDLSKRHMDSTISLSQFSVATTNTAEASAFESRHSEEQLSRNSMLFESYVGKDSERPSSRYGTTINEKHVNYILMYDMLTGIRIATSSCQAKPSRPLAERDFSRIEKLGFDPQGNETTPSSRFEFKFKDYAPWVFRYIREASRIDAADYLVSLTGKYALSELGSSGKSGSFFYYSQDLRFIIKTIRRSEHIFLRKILRYYYEHLRTNPNTLLTRIFGLHRLRMTATRKIYFVVMSNIFPPNKDIHEIYDLKGATQGRYVSASNPDSAIPITLKDLNWIENKRKLVLGPEKATLLMNQLKSDCQFLAKLNIMDYSLLVGLHSVPKGNTGRNSLTVLEPSASDHHRFRRSQYSSLDLTEIPKEKRLCEFYADEGGFRSSLRDNSPGDELYFLGIIDILTPYNSLKKIEHVIKSLQFDQSTISTVNPSEYCKRFLKFMAENIFQDKSANYANKPLPALPDEYEEITGPDDTIIIDLK